MFLTFSIFSFAIILFFIANKCYYMDEEEFVDHVIDRYHEKRRYAEFLEKEGSMLAKNSRANQHIFRLRNSQGNAPEKLHQNQQYIIIRWSLSTLSIQKPPNLQAKVLLSQAISLKKFETSMQNCKRQASHLTNEPLQIFCA